MPKWMRFVPSNEVSRKVTGSPSAAKTRRLRLCVEVGHFGYLPMSVGMRVSAQRHQRRVSSSVDQTTCDRPASFRAPLGHGAWPGQILFPGRVVQKKVTQNAAWAPAKARDKAGGSSRLRNHLGPRGLTPAPLLVDVAR
jgi:hypothetical protein